MGHIISALLAGGGGEREKEKKQGKVFVPHNKVLVHIPPLGLISAVQDSHQALSGLRLNEPTQTQGVEKDQELRRQVERHATSDTTTMQADLVISYSMRKFGQTYGVCIFFSIGLPDLTMKIQGSQLHQNFREMTSNILLQHSPSHQTCCIFFKH